MLHLIKLTVGCPSLAILAERMAEHRIGGHGVVHTRTMPKRREEVLDGGSIYRVIDGMILCRQPILDLQSARRADGSEATLIVVSDDIIPVIPRPMRPFQGWRYLKPEDAPADLGRDSGAGADMPIAMRRALAELGLL